MDQSQIENAKKRIWNRMQSKLPDRGLSPYQNLLGSLRSYEAPMISRLTRVQSKEHLLDILPDRPAPTFSLRRMWGVGSLLAVLSVIFMPVLQKVPVASASTVNTVEVVEGQVYVNGESIQESVIVRPGDRIETAEGSMAHIYFVDDSRMTLAPSTRVDIVDTEIDELNKTNTKVEVRQESGRAWVQVLNLLSSNDSYFLVTFPDGEVEVDTRASFDIAVGDETRVSVARNLVDLSLQGEDTAYAGTLGQGAEIVKVEDSIQTEKIPSEREEDLWWEFNDAYGRTYAQVLDDHYKEEASLQATLLPTNPFYFLKTFREDVQVSLAFTSSAKEELLVQQAENRLMEAQILFAKGETEVAEQVLNDYQSTVQEALENTDNPVLLAKLDMTQKQMLTASDVDEGTQILEDHLVTSSAIVSSSLEDKTEVRMYSASQKLERVPDLIANGNFEQALTDLSSYQSSSLSILTELENIPMDQREQVVSALLDQKLEDIQLLRVIASMPETSEAVSIDTQMLEQMSMMVLSLKEQQLSDLSTFFESTDYDLDVQYNVYNRLKDDTEIGDELNEQFATVENEIQNTPQSDDPVIEIEETPTTEPEEETAAQ